MARLFISYARKDRTFAEQLATTLESRGYLPDYDLSPAATTGVELGISAEDEWWARLQEMIAAADVVVFVLSPSAVRSRVCDEEVAYARALGKRVIPVLLQQIDFTSAPPRVSALNVKISFVEGESVFEEAVETLVAAIERDVRWLREFTRIIAAAQLWEAAGRPPDRLLHGEEIRAADALAARRPASVPELPELLLRYLADSRERDAERRTIGEIERARYLELVRITRSFLKAELQIRETRPIAEHAAVADEDRREAELLRSLLHLDGKWHPEAARFIASTRSAREGYAEVFEFPCCSLVVRDYESIGEGEPPSQFRSDGCRDVPRAVQHEYRERSNPFTSQLVREYNILSSGRDT